MAMTEQKLHAIASFCGVKAAQDKELRERLVPLMILLEVHLRAVRAADIDGTSPFADFPGSRQEGRA